jgi:hypothetical protein
MCANVFIKVSHQPQLSYKSWDLIRIAPPKKQETLK